MHGHWEADAQQAADILTVNAETRGLRPVALHEALRAQGNRAGRGWSASRRTNKASPPRGTQPDSDRRARKAATLTRLAHDVLQ